MGNFQPVQPIQQQIQQNLSNTGQAPTKRVKICQEFLRLIDETGEFEGLLSDELHDEIKHARKMVSIFKL